LPLVLFRRKRKDNGNDKRRFPSGMTNKNGEMQGIFGFSCGKMCLNPNKTDKNRKKPVETEEIWLTKPLERLKVNCGTVLRTRMNTEDFALKNDAGLDEKFMRTGVADPRTYF
jgi:hypothetical protein